jgi:hypothetical protein
VLFEATRERARVISVEKARQVTPPAATTAAAKLEIRNPRRLTRIIVRALAKAGQQQQVSVARALRCIKRVLDAAVMGRSGRRH